MTLGSRLGLRAASAGFALAVCLGGAPGIAQEADAGTRMAARELAVAGAEAFDKQDFATALDRFKRAESLYKVPSISVMVARCYASVGRVVEAVDKYEETLRAPLDAAAPEAFQRAVAEAAVEVEVARARVARIEIHLPAEAPESAVVLLDDKPVPRALIGVPTPVNPGAHRLSASAPGRAPFSSDFSLEEGARRTLAVSLDARAATPGHAAAAPAPSKRGVSPLAIGFLTGGGLAVAAGAVTGVSALNHRSKLEAGCKPGCPSNLADELSDFRRDRALSYLGFGVGLAAAGVGTYFLLHDSGSSGTEMGAVVLPGGAALRGTF
ncbi:MAG TPA: hypothetical protein VHP33_11175 [Polyangiaceae bacterium]|nr:hypothetical protein [Polyangiaceae bacterium]